MVTYERPKWVLPGQQWSAGQTQLQYEQAGGKLAPGVSSVISAPITPYTPPAPIYAPTTPVVAPELAAFNQQMVNAPAPNVASPGYTGYGAAGAQGYYVKDSIAYDKATNRRIVELGKGWQFAEPAPTPTTPVPAGLAAFNQQMVNAPPTPSGQLTPEQTKYFQDQIAKIQTGITSIQNPIPVSGQGAAPTLPPQPSGAITQSYYSSAAQDLLKARTALEDAYTKQITDLQTKIDVSNKKIQDLNILQQEGIISNIETLSQPFREDLEKSERQRLYINQNFEDNQKLTNELDALLTEGNTIISEMKGVTGLAAIRNPRINDTITKISQRTGVIQAVMAARNNQINVAENMIDRSVNALAADKQDQINYYETLYNFYQSQKNKEGSKLITLTKDQKTYLNAQIGLLENDLKISQDSADYIKKLLTNPSNALLIAQAGVTLGDPPEVVNTKIATQIQRQEVIDFTNKKIEDGYIPFPQTGQQGLATFNVGGQNLTFKAPPKKATGGMTPDNKAVAYDAIKQRTIKLFADGATQEEYQQMRQEIINMGLGSYLDDFDKFATPYLPAEPISLDKVKSTIIDTLRPQKDVYSRDEAKTMAENQLSAALKLKTGQILPESYSKVIEDALTEVYGAKKPWYQFW